MFDISATAFILKIKLLLHCHCTVLFRAILTDINGFRAILTVNKGVPLVHGKCAFPCFHTSKSLATSLTC